MNLWLAYLDPAQKDEQLNQMITQPSAFVLPFRKETLPMLKWAKSEISSWKVDYYLALNLMALGQEEEGHQLIEAIGQSADEATFYLSRALLLDQQEDKKKQEDLEKALSMDQSQWRTWFQLTKHFDNNGENQKALSLVKEAVKAFPGNYVLEMEYIQLLNQAGQYKTAMKLLDKIEVLPHEGAGGGRTLYESVYLNATLQDIKAKRWNAALTKIEKSRLWPENLGVGKPYTPKEILQDYLSAMVYKAKNEQSKSRDYLEAVIAQADKVNINSQEQALVLLAMKNNSQKAAAAELMEKIKKEGKAASVVKIEQLIDYAESSESAPSDLENDKGIVKRIIEAF